jgi:hypothetical protein
MGRGSSKHGPHTDEFLKREMEEELRARRPTRDQEWREPELQTDPDHEEPEVDLNPAGELVGGVAEALRPEDLEGRSEIARHLGPSAFPGDKASLRRRAESLHAPDHVLEWIDRLPEGRTFHNVQEVWVTLGGRGEV